MTTFAFQAGHNSLQHADTLVDSEQLRGAVVA